MSERTEISFDAALMMALRADAQKEADNSDLRCACSKCRLPQGGLYDDSEVLTN